MSSLESAISAYRVSQGWDDDYMTGWMLIMGGAHMEGGQSVALLPSEGLGFVHQLGMIHYIHERMRARVTE